LESNPLSQIVSDVYLPANKQTKPIMCLTRKSSTHGWLESELRNLKNPENGVIKPITPYQDTVPANPKQKNAGHALMMFLYFLVVIGSQESELVQ